jgi:hypothetical protein
MDKSPTQLKHENISGILADLEARMQNIRDSL